MRALSCVEACPGGALRLTVCRREGLQRRNFLSSRLGARCRLGLASIRRYVNLHRFRNRGGGRAPSPPRFAYHENFSQKCIACSACRGACPAGLSARPVGLGASGLFQPRLDYDFGYCHSNCNSCTAVCPAGPSSPSLEAKQRVQIGRAQFHRNACIVVKNGTACGACSEHCPTQAAAYGPLPGRALDPAIDPSLCIDRSLPFRLPRGPEAMTVRGCHPRTLNRDGPGEGPVLDPLEEFPFRLQG